ncbi:MAG: hypothetical protein ACI4XH_02075 [Acutalibacteraceae bacterium]
MILKKMPTQNPDIELNRKENTDNEISLARYEIILTDYEIFG